VKNRHLTSRPLILPLMNRQPTNLRPIRRLMNRRLIARPQLTQIQLINPQNKYC
jgi:hypothetical protein